ncbi:hypothetical protein [Kitasatospora sp. NPDC057198]|uniref:hypothetical protein n=1 Tax=Kitasatospora sp. NPDC057198 TaxID=3346046 RepID=UPI00362CAC14
MIDRMAAFDRSWGGLVLPPANDYEGGPKPFFPDVPEQDEEGWWFMAGDQRTSVPFAFYLGPDDEFCLLGDGRSVRLHASVEGWVESQALAHHARLWARRVSKLHGADADGLDLAGFEPVPEVRGLADTWWRGADSLVEVHRGEHELFAAPGASPYDLSRTAFVYEGLDEWGLTG